MLKIKPEYLSKHGKRQFVVLTVEDFERLKTAAEDALDLKTLRRATKANAKAGYVAADEVKRRYAKSGRGRG